MTYPYAQIIRRFSCGGYRYIEVRCGICGGIHVHGDAPDIQGQIRYSHCNDPIERGNYILTLQNVEPCELTASIKDKYIANVIMAGRFPEGLEMSLDGLQISQSVPAGTERYQRLERLLDYMDNSGIQL